MANCEWCIASGKLRVAKCEWQIVSGELSGGELSVLRNGVGVDASSVVADLLRICMGGSEFYVQAWARVLPLLLLASASGRCLWLGVGASSRGASW